MKFSSLLVLVNVIMVMYGFEIDWEIELVVMIGKGGCDIVMVDVMVYVVGVMVGEDLFDWVV